MLRGKVSSFSCYQKFILYGLAISHLEKWTWILMFQLVWKKQHYAIKSQWAGERGGEEINCFWWHENIQSVAAMDCRWEVWSTWDVVRYLWNLGSGTLCLWKAGMGKSPVYSNNCHWQVICPGTGRGLSFHSRGQDLSICTSLHTWTGGE